MGSSPIPVANTFFMYQVSVSCKKFAAGCSREVIERGADMLGWSLDELMERTITAMQASLAANGN